MEKLIFSILTDNSVLVYDQAMFSKAGITEIVLDSPNFVYIDKNGRLHCKDFKNIPSD